MPDDTSPVVEISEEDLAVAVSPYDVAGRVNARLSRLMENEIHRIAEDSRYPLNSVSEVVRYCCSLGLEKLRQWKPTGNMLGTIKAASALLLRDRLQYESLELLERLDERVEWYISQKLYDEVIDLVARTRACFDNMPDDFWSVRIQQEIDKRFVAWMDRIDIEKIREK